MGTTPKVQIVEDVGRGIAGEGTTTFLAILEQIAHAVGYAHTHGVIHRDLKPSSVMVGAFGEVQVMDSGMAKVLASGGEVFPEFSNDPQATAAYGTSIDTPDQASAGRPR